MYYGYSISPQELTHVDRICIIAWGLIGDVFFRIPVIEAVARRFPQAHISVVVEPSGVAVLQNHPDCDELIIISRKKKPFFRYIRGFIAGVTRLRQGKFDLMINLYSGGSSPLLTRLSGARIRLGFDHTPALRKANNLLVKKPNFCRHWSKDLGVKLRPLGVDEEQVRRGTTFVIDGTSLQEAKSLLPGNERRVAFNLGAGVAEKRWPVARFVELARKIHDKYGLSPVVFTNPGMEQLGEAFAQQYGRKECEIMPLLPLGSVAAVMRQCEAVVTGDTSLMHLAFGVKAPNMTLFTYTRPEIVEPEDCLHVACFVEDKEKLDRCNKHPGTTDIPVDLALEKFDQLISRLSAEENHA